MVSDPWAKPPSWDAFSRVNTNKLAPEDYEDEDERTARETAEQRALVKAKPTSISGWDPETRTQKILTDEDMQSKRSIAHVRPTCLIVLMVGMCRSDVHRWKWHGRNGLRRLASDGAGGSRHRTDV